MYRSPSDEGLHLVPGDASSFIEVHLMPDILKALVTDVGCVLELVTHGLVEQGEICSHVFTIKFHDVLLVDGLEELFHLGVLVFQGFALLFICFFVIFVNEVVEFNAL